MGRGARPPCRLKSRGAGDPVEGGEGGAVHRRRGEAAPAARCVGEGAPVGDPEEGGGEEGDVGGQGDALPGVEEAETEL